MPAPVLGGVPRERSRWYVAASTRSTALAGVVDAVERGRAARRRHASRRRRRARARRRRRGGDLRRRRARRARAGRRCAAARRRHRDGSRPAARDDERVGRSGRQTQRERRVLHRAREDADVVERSTPAAPRRRAGSRPCVGLSPTTPQYAAGRSTEPTVCEPSASGTMRAPTAAAEPRRRAARRVARGSTGCASAPDRGRRTRWWCTLPRITAPAARSRATDGASASAACGRTRARPRAVGRPATSKMSLSATGTPCSGADEGARRGLAPPARAAVRARPRDRRAPRPAPRARACRCAPGTPPPLRRSQLARADPAGGFRRGQGRESGTGRQWRASRTSATTSKRPKDGIRYAPRSGGGYRGRALAPSRSPARAPDRPRRAAARGRARGW